MFVDSTWWEEGSQPEEDQIQEVDPGNDLSDIESLLEVSEDDDAPVGQHDEGNC